jgi:hypothetical protein
MNERVANMVNINYDYNLYYLANCQTPPAAHDLKDVDPKFVATDTDFHLQSSSPAKDAGIDVGVTFDFDGLPRPYGTKYDIGAYEYRVVPIHDAGNKVHSDISVPHSIMPNPIRAAQIHQYLQTNKEAKVYDLTGTMVNKESFNEGIYLISEGPNTIPYKITIIK